MKINEKFDKQSLGYQGYLLSKTKLSLYRNLLARHGRSGSNEMV